jgi:diaminohydroxyphosphoribosylaminopyrimidine deaminase/5-amino-6-(5-phosphoribosylamino)uracil reductase
MRIVVDRNLQLSPQARVLEGGNVLVFCARDDEQRAARLRDAGAEVVALPDAQGKVDLAAMMRELARRELNEIHVEAGSRLNGALLAAGVVDEVLLYLAPALIGDPALGIATFVEARRTLDARVRLAIHAVDRVGEDLRVIARVRNEGSE